METGEALRTYAEGKMADLQTYFDQVTDVHVGFAQGAHQCKADVNVVASGLTLRAEGEGADWYGALDSASEKLGRQLLRYKGRLEKRRETHAKFKEAQQLEPLTFESADLDERKLEDTFSEFAPAVIKKDVSRVAPMTVDDAIMQMDLLHRPAFLFLNVETGQLNMVHRDGENTIRWVAPKKVG
jgi:putative sigma-54 modulation protein